MPTLNIALEEGFRGNPVIIRVNGKQIYSKESVTTRLQTGYADSLQTDVSATPAQVEITLPDRSLSQSILVDPTQEAYLRVSLNEDGTITHRTQNSPQGYL